MLRKKLNFLLNVSFLSIFLHHATFHFPKYGNWKFGGWLYYLVIYTQLHETVFDRVLCQANALFLWPFLRNAILNTYPFTLFFNASASWPFSICENLLWGPKNLALVQLTSVCKECVSYVKWYDINRFQFHIPPLLCAKFASYHISK